MNAVHIRRVVDGLNLVQVLHDDHVHAAENRERDRGMNPDRLVGHKGADDAQDGWAKDDHEQGDRHAYQQLRCCQVGCTREGGGYAKGVSHVSETQKLKP